MPDPTQEELDAANARIEARRLLRETREQFFALERLQVLEGYDRGRGRRCRQLLERIDELFIQTLRDPESLGLVRK